MRTTVVVVVGSVLFAAAIVNGAIVDILMKKLWPCKRFSGLKHELELDYNYSNHSLALNLVYA